MHPYSYNISLRLKHPSRELSDIYQKLSQQTELLPGRIWSFGSNRQTIHGKPLEGTYDSSYFYFDFFEFAQESNIQDPIIKIETSLLKLSKFKNDFQEVVESGGEVEYFLTLFIDSNSSLVFDVNFMKKLVEMEIQLVLDIYPPTTDSLKGNGNGISHQ